MIGAVLVVGTSRKVEDRAYDFTNATTSTFSLPSCQREATRSRWQVKRLTALVTSPSLALDVATGRLQAVLSTERDIRELARRPDGTWTTARRIAGTRGVEAGVLRRDPVTGHLLLVASRWHEGNEKVEVVAFVKS